MATAAKTPDIYEVAESFREQLLALDAKTASKMAAAYRQGYKRMYDRMMAVGKLIEDAKAAGEPVHPADLFQHERWTQAYNAIRDELTAYKQAAAGHVTDAQGAAIDLGGAHTDGLMRASLGDDVGQGFSFATVNDANVRAMVGMASGGGPIARLFESITTQEVADRSRHLLTQAAVLGTNPEVLARQLRGPLAIPMWRAMTIARTETMRAYREAQRQSIVENQSILEGWVWLSAKDARTCEVCWAQDGKLFPIESVTATEAAQMAGHQEAVVPVATDTGLTHGPAVVQSDTGLEHGPAFVPPLKKAAASIAEINDGDDVVAVMTAKYPGSDWSSFAGRSLRVPEMREALEALDQSAALMPWMTPTKAQLAPVRYGGLFEALPDGTFTFSDMFDDRVPLPDAYFYDPQQGRSVMRPAASLKEWFLRRGTNGSELYDPSIRGIVHNQMYLTGVNNDMFFLEQKLSIRFQDAYSILNPAATLSDLDDAWNASAVKQDMANLRKVIQFGPIRTVKGASVDNKLRDLYLSMMMGEDHGPKKTGAFAELFAAAAGKGDLKIGVAPTIKKAGKVKQLLGIVKPRPTKPFTTGNLNKWLTELDNKSLQADGQMYHGSSAAKRRIQIDLTKRIREDDAKLGPIADTILDHDADWQRGDTYAQKLRESVGRLRNQSMFPGSIPMPADPDAVDPLGYGPRHDAATKKWWGTLTREQRVEILRAVPDDWDHNALGKYTSDRVQGWAVTSMDSQPACVAMQQAAHEEFALKSSMGHVRWQEPFRMGNAPYPTLQEATDKWYATHGEAYRGFLRAMYENTQEQFAAAGIKTVRLARGTGSSLGNTLKPSWKKTSYKSHSPYKGYKNPVTGEIKDGYEWINNHGESRSILDDWEEYETGGKDELPDAVVKMQPMSSFSSASSVSKRFGRYVSYADVPSDWIIGTARTGYGCLEEREWVVLSMDDEWTVYMRKE